MLMPKRVKYRKPHRLSYEGKSKGNTELHFGEYGLQATEGDYLSLYAEFMRSKAKCFTSDLFGYLSDFEHYLAFFDYCNVLFD